MVDVKPCLEKIAGRFADPTVQQSLKGFNKTLLFVFLDTGENWSLRAVDGKEAFLSQDIPEKADVTITTTSEVLTGILDKKLNPLTAYMQHKLQVKGATEDLMKLQKLLA